MPNRSIVALTLTLVAGASWGCGSSSSGNGDSNTSRSVLDAGGADSSSNVTFTKLYSDVLSGSCAFCHAPGGTGVMIGELDMSTQALAYANLLLSAAGASCKASGLKRVVPGAAAMSLLFEKVDSANPPCGSQMPFTCGGASCLAAAQVQEIEDWINDGAPND